MIAVHYSVINAFETNTRAWQTIKTSGVNLQVATHDVYDVVLMTIH